METKKAATESKKAPAEKKKAPKPHTPRNYVLAGSGIMRYSRHKMYKRKAMYRLKKKGVFEPKKDVVKKPKPATTVTKPIGGEKNGGTRTVSLKSQPKSYPTQELPRKLKKVKAPFKKHKRHLKSSIKRGTVLILVAGRHRGKRVVFLKQLASGLLLVTGPFRINACPLRRVNQIYTIATKTTIDLKGVKIPQKLNDDYFKRKVLKKPKHTEGEIFDNKKEKYVVSEERKKDQAHVDNLVMGAIAKNSDKKLLFAYLGRLFSLKNHQYPHKMVF
jgi:large subunit ribosomal protein L6e